jgi:hypothetical protein
LDSQLKNAAEASLEEIGRTDKRPARGLEDVSHLFLSQSPDRPAEKAKTSDMAPVHAPSQRAQSRTPFLLRDFPTVSRELIAQLLNGNAAALEEGMNAIDANIPCDPFGFIDLMAVDGQNQLCLINIDVAQKDDLLLRAIAYSDWIVRNTPIVRRMYQGRAINFSAQPRVILVAPGFSPLLKCVAQSSMSPKVRLFTYRTVAMPGGVGILLEHA